METAIWWVYLGFACWMLFFVLSFGRRRRGLELRPLSFALVLSMFDASLRGLSDPILSKPMGEL